MEQHDGVGVAPSLRAPADGKSVHVDRASHRRPGRTPAAVALKLTKVARDEKEEGNATEAR